MYKGVGGSLLLILKIFHLNIMRIKKKVVITKLNTFKNLTIKWKMVVIDFTDLQVNLID